MAKYSIKISSTGLNVDIGASNSIVSVIQVNIVMALLGLSLLDI